MSVDIEAHEKADKRTGRLVLGWLLIVALLAWLIFQQSEQEQRDRDAAQKQAQQSQQKTEQVQKDAGALTDRFKAECAARSDADSAQICARLFSIADKVAESAEDAPSPAAPALTPVQVAAIVSDYCNTPAGNCKGKPTIADILTALSTFCAADKCKGEDAPAPTREALVQSVSVYCESIGGCKPANGKDGADGADGADGEDGADATDEQILAQVSAFCAPRNDCTPEPIPGPEGAAGADAPTPTGQRATCAEAGDATSQADNALTVTTTYSDGSTTAYTYTTNCAPPAPPAPSPTPTPTPTATATAPAA